MGWARRNAATIGWLALVALTLTVSAMVSHRVRERGGLTPGPAATQMTQEDDASNGQGLAPAAHDEA